MERNQVMITPRPAMVYPENVSTRWASNEIPESMTRLLMSSSKTRAGFPPFCSSHRNITVENRHNAEYGKGYDYQVAQRREHPACIQFRLEQR